MELLVVSVLLLHSLASALPTGVNLPPFSVSLSESFPYHAELDSNYHLFWNFNDTHITFEAHVKTNGYVAFGISPNGKMHPADVIVGWVKDGRSYFQDSHTTGYMAPVADASQDWILLSATEISDVTVLKFQRKLETCDDPDDLPILEGTTRVIYSYHPDDPSDITRMTYHGSARRGAKSLLLLDPPSSDSDTKEDPSDVKIFDFVNRNYSLPADDTTYHCTTWLLPNLDKKHQMIKYEPVIQPGNEKFVHHVVIYTCPQPVNSNMAGLDYICNTGAPPELKYCYTVIIAWATGGKEFVFPDHVGFPLASGGEPRFFLMEVHYDNPDRRSDIVDNSGIRIHLTSKVRQHDAGIVEVGAGVTKFQIVPPQSPGFFSRGYCASECIEQSMVQSGVDEVKVFASLLHSHLLGRGMKARVIRGDQEIHPPAQDNNYDFNYQEMRVLREEFALKKGDKLITECFYKSMDRTNVTFGGVGTRDEMCETFLYFYPRISLSFCISDLMYDNLPQGETNIHHYLKKLDFTKDETHKNFTKMVDESKISALCLGKGVNEYRQLVKTQSEFVPAKPYVKPSRCP